MKACPDPYRITRRKTMIKSIPSEVVVLVFGEGHVKAPSGMPGSASWLKCLVFGSSSSSLKPSFLIVSINKIYNASSRNDCVLSYSCSLLTRPALLPQHPTAATLNTDSSWISRSQHLRNTTILTFEPHDQRPTWQTVALSHCHCVFSAVPTRTHVTLR